MTLFASKTSRDLPWHAGQAVTVTSITINGEAGSVVEREYQQYNDPNPILVGFREEIEGGAGRERYSWGAGCMVRYSESEAFAHVAGYFLSQMKPMGTDLRLPRIAFGIDATPAHINHARLVLKRLSNLAQNGDN